VADVAVILDEKDRQTPKAIGRAPAAHPTGVAMPLRELAEIYPSSDASPSCTRARAGVRLSPARTSGRDVSSFVEEAQKRPR